VIVRVPDLSSEVRSLQFSESAVVLNDVLSSASGWTDQTFDRDLDVAAEIYKHGTDVYFNGTVTGLVNSTCPRCLDEFQWPLRRRFQFLIVKALPGQGFEDDAGLDHYETEELDLGRLAREQALLAVDAVVPCSEGCRGLCPGCGANRNREPCTCTKPPRNS
jgi:uncharacterized protein